MNEWPDARAFRENWPLLALDLLIAQWKIERALAMIAMPEPVLRERAMSRPVRRGHQPPYILEIAQEIEVDLLYPAPLEQHDWRQVYAAELAAHPELASDLSPEREQGDGIELVLERAQLRDNERWVVRDYLSGKSIELISEDSGWKAQSLQNLLNNGLARLRGLVQATNGGRPPERGVVISKGASRSRRGHVSSPPAASVEADRTSPGSRGSGPGGLREVRAEAAPTHAQRFPAAQLDVHGDEAPERRLMAALG